MSGSRAVKRILVGAVALVLVAGVDVFLFTLARDRYAKTKYQVYLPEDIRCRTEGYPRLGEESAPIGIVAYTDFECRFSEELHHSLDTVVSRFGQDIVKIHFKPRPIHESPELRLRAHAALAAHRQGKFFAIRPLLSAIQPVKDKRGRGEKLREEIRKAAHAAGIDTARFEQDITSSQVKEMIREVVAETERYGIYRYPSVFINGHLIQGAHPSDYYERRIRELLSDTLVAAIHTEEQS